MSSYIQLFKQINQPHLIEIYNSISQKGRCQLQKQIDQLNQIYSGGLCQYYETSTLLLQNLISKQSQTSSQNNPLISQYSNYFIQQPKGIYFQTSSHKLEDLEKIKYYQSIGAKQWQYTVFVLVAGGLGQRLGYGDIKLGIIFELLNGKMFIQYYCEYILQYQHKYCSEGTIIPLTIMTSDDTHQRTQQVLIQNNYFGMSKYQITLVKQQKVPAFIFQNGKCLFSIKTSSKNSSKHQTPLIQLKPHGHGDIHTLLYQHGLIQKWSSANKKWIIFFQDTNPLAFRSYNMLLGVSKQQDYDYNSLTISRKPGQSYGAITTFINKQNKQKSITINIEYNIVQQLFKLKLGHQPTDQNGWSKFPGNINSFSIKISDYRETLKRTKGKVTEFINPKFTDQTKTKFKSPIRLQSMMQDYPQLLENCNKVGFTNVPKGLCFTTLKNDLKTAVSRISKGLSGESASTCQAEFYFFTRQLLRLCGAQIEQDEPITISYIKLSLFPMIYISPKFATCYSELNNKIKKLKVSAKSSLVIESDCILQDVEIDGHAVIKDSGNIVMKAIQKNYKTIVPIKGNQQTYLQIRGYTLV